MNILYYITRWEVGTAYKNVNFMRDRFGGKIVKDSVSEAYDYIKKHKADFMVVRGDARKDYYIALKNKIPYILIANDIMGMRVGRILESDKHMIENASGVIFTSEYHVKYCQENNIKIPYYEVIHSRPLMRDLKFVPQKKLPGLNLVYAGGIGARWNSRAKPHGYRQYHKIFEQFLSAGWKVHLYPATANNLQEYKDMGCNVYSKITYKELLSEMSQYTAGFHGYNKDGVPKTAYEYSQNCIGNKCWDYLMAGIPTIGFQGGKGMDIYRNKWGIVLRSLSKRNLENLPKRLEKLNITEQLKYENLMDNDIEKYQNIVNKALKDKKVIAKQPTVIISEWKDDCITIQVENKRPYQIERGNLILEPYEKTKLITVSKSQWEEIKSHVGLKILYF